MGRAFAIERHRRNQCALSGRDFAAVNVIVSYKLFDPRHLQLTNITFWRWFQVFIVSRFINFHFAGRHLYRILKLKNLTTLLTPKRSNAGFSNWAEMVVNLAVTNILLFFCLMAHDQQSMVLYVLFILYRLFCIPVSPRKIVTILPAAQDGGVGKE